MMKKIILHGYLKDLHPEPICIEADTVAEAVSVLRNYPGFNPDEGNRHTVAIRGFESRDSLYMKTDVEEIHIEPTLSGGGGGSRPGIFQIVIGALLIAASFIPALAPISPYLRAAGLSMMIGGVIALLAPSPNNKDGGPASRILGASENTVKIGTPIPMMIGRIKHFGHYISFNVDAVDYNGFDTIDPGHSIFGGWNSLINTLGQAFWNSSPSYDLSQWDVVTNETTT